MTICTSFSISLCCFNPLFLEVKLMHKYLKLVGSDKIKNASREAVNLIKVVCIPGEDLLRIMTHMTYMWKVVLPSNIQSRAICFISKGWNDVIANI